MGKPANYFFCKCTCGRKPHDFTDLAVLREEDGKHYSSGTGKAVNRYKVVCLRPGCYGAWKTMHKYAQTLPRMFNLEYIREKEKAPGGSETPGAGKTLQP